MRLSEFIKSNKTNTKIVLADKVSVGNALIRICNLRDGIASFNIVTKTPLDIAREILDAKVQMEKQIPVEYLSPESSVYLMMNVLRDINSDLLPESTLTIGTAREVLLRINELRENGVTEAYTEEIKKGGKIKELDIILKAYEKTISDKDLYDKHRIISEAAVICKEEDVTKSVPYLKGAVFGELITNKWTASEKAFTEALLLSMRKADPASKKEIIEFLEKESDSGLSFFKARGMTNEVRYAAQKMKKIAEKESYGTIALYYSSPEYLNVLKAVLDAERIPYCVSGGSSTKELHLTQFFISLLNSAEKNFSYELLEKVVRNKVVTFDNVLKGKTVDPYREELNEDEDRDADETEMTEAQRSEKIAELSDEENARQDSVKVNPIRGYRRALSSGIGWGKNRYMDYYDRVMKNEKSEENEKVFARFLYDFVNVFDDKLSIGEIYRKLWEFVQLYTYAVNPEKAVLNKLLYEKCNELMLIDSTGYSLKEKIAFIRDMIENMKAEDMSEKGEAVCIFPMKDIFVMERKHNFLTGMSATSFSADDKQSPLLLDEEKKKYINGVYEEGRYNGNSPVEIASKNYARLAENVKNSLCTRSMDADVTISYSYYDSINLRAGSPSVLFIELSSGKEIEEAPGYLDAPYVVRDDISLSVEDLNKSVKERAEMLEEIREEKRKKREAANGIGSKEKANDAKVGEFSMSASGIQTLLACPLMYYYQYIKYLRIDDHMTPKGHEWMDVRNKGNICHYTMEKYMKNAKDPAGGIEMQLFDDAYDRSLEEIKEQQPVYSDEVKERETIFYKDRIRDYLEFLCKNWADDLNAGKEWKVIGCEIPFGKLDETGSLKPVYRGKGYEIYLNGSIDRADGYMTDDGKLMLRIIDYKTGKKENKQTEIEHGVQIQHYLYAMALCDYLDSDAGKARCRKLFGRDYTGYDFEWVGYTFPYTENDDERLLNTLDMISMYDHDCSLDEGEPGKTSVRDRIAKLPKDIAEQLDHIIGNIQTGNEDLVSDEIERLIHSKRKERKDENDKTPGPEMSLSKFCEDNYCKYKQICRNWVGYADADENAEED